MSLGARSPVEADRWTLLEWRNSDRVRDVSINERVIEREEHGAWFDRLLAERLDSFLVVTWDEEAVGVVQLEGLDREQKISSWGCHLGVVEVPPGVGACLPLLGLGLGFGRHGLRRMTAEVLASNRNMASMHRRFRIPNEGVRRQHVRRSGGETVDVHIYGVLADEWLPIVERGAGLLPQQVRDGVHAVVAELQDSGPNAG